MLPRERALAAFEHQLPDVIPAYVRNIMDWERHAAHLGVVTRDELFAALGNTMVTYAPACLIPQDVGRVDPQGDPLSIWGVPEGAVGTYTDTVPRPLAGAETIADVDSFPWPSGDGWDFAGMRRQLESDRTYARLSPSWMPVFSKLCEVFGMEKAMISLHTDLPIIEAALAHIDDFYATFYGNLLATCADRLDVFGLGDDFAGNFGLLISPETWRRLFKPLYAKWLAMAKARDLHTFLHCCGNIVEVLPDLIDSGLDAWQTVQTHLPGQGARRIKREFGQHLTFIGGIDTTNVLSYATPEQVRQHVRQQIRLLGEGGGYICAPDHTIMAEVQSANVVALYEECGAFQGNGFTLA